MWSNFLPVTFCKRAEVSMNGNQAGPQLDEQEGLTVTMENWLYAILLLKDLYEVTATFAVCTTTRLYWLIEHGTRFTDWQCYNCN